MTSDVTDMDPCPQCGVYVDGFREGVCEDCAAANQADLDAHNAAFDRWDGMSDRQRAAEIRGAIR